MKWFGFSKKSVFNRKYANQLYNQTQEAVNSITPVQILVAGKTGSGKSTLINGIFRERLAETGVGQPITQNLEKITKEGVPIVLFDTKGFELTTQSRHEILLSIANLIKKNQDTQLGVDVVYYCINSIMGRIEPFEIDLIKAISEYVPIIVVLTQDIGQSKKFETYLKKLNLPIVGIVPLLAKKYLIRGQQIIPAYGLQDLIDLTLEVIPESSQKAFINAQQVDIDRKVSAARSWANKYISTAFGVGFTPIPFADSVVLVPMQITMMAHITAIFGLSLDKSQIISILAGVGGTGTATYIGKLLSSSLLKFIPGIGTASGSIITGITASTITLALAYSYIEVLRKISLSELTGKDLKLAEIQKLMNQNLKEQLIQLGDFLPGEIQEFLTIKK